MKILIDIGHPAHVHLFKNFAIEMQKKGHILMFTCRDKEFEIELLKTYDFKYVSFGRKFKSISGKILGLLIFNFKMLITSLKFKPDIFLSHGSMYAAHVSWLIRKPHLTFEDTFNFEQIKLYKPFTSVILTSDYKHPDLGKRNIKYRGYHELAYLHPRKFTPNNEVRNQLGVSTDEKYCILRFVSWEATHDINHNGISLENKRKLVERLSKYSKVFISSEKELPSDLMKYKFPLHPNKMHDAMAFASLIFGESATMISEGAVLGTPGIYLDNTGRLYTNELEEVYNLVFNYNESEKDQIKAIDKAVEIIQSEESNIWVDRRSKLLDEKINVSEFLVWFVEKYPESKEIMRNNQNFQNKFK